MNSALPPINPKELKKRLESAGTAGLRYVSAQMPGITREKSGEVFRYRYATGDVVSDEEVLKRIKALVIPPAWTDVWICPDPCGHLQATGRDARGRKQNRYHPRWREVCDENKYTRMIAFGKALPRMRQAVERDLKLAGLPRSKVLATVVRLLELSLIRVGNPEYAKSNKSFGLTTMRDKHVDVKGEVLRFSFRGKAGKWHDVGIRDRRLARTVKRCQDLPGQELFQYVTDDGKRQTISSEDVNDYLKEISGRDFTAKDFRTWAGTVLASEALSQTACHTKKEAKKNLVAAIQAVSERLGNTPAVCKKCYIHPHVIAAYTDGRLVDALRMRQSTRPPKTGLRLEEKSVLQFLKQRLALEKKEQAHPGAPFKETLKLLRSRKAKGGEKRDELKRLAA